MYIYHMIHRYQAKTKKIAFFSRLRSVIYCLKQKKGKIETYFSFCFYSIDYLYISKFKYTNFTMVKSKRKVIFDGTLCRYPVIRNRVLEMGWELFEADEHSKNKKSTVIWVDVACILEKYPQLKNWQRINHFPGMTNLARKNRMAQHLARMRKSFSALYSFYPRTWSLPFDSGDLSSIFNNKGVSPYVLICKPDSGCQGRGEFFLTDFLCLFFKGFKGFKHAHASHLDA